MFDPWTAGEKHARETERLYRAFGGDPDSARSPFLQWLNATMVTAARPRVEEGDGFETMRCGWACIRCGLVAPDWLAAAFDERYRRVAAADVISWDAESAFGKPYAPGKHASALHKYKTKAWAVYEAVESELHSNPGQVKDKGLFERIGKPFDLGITLAEDYYFTVQRNLGQDSEWGAWAEALAKRLNGVDTESKPADSPKFTGEADPAL